MVPVPMPSWGDESPMDLMTIASATPYRGKPSRERRNPLAVRVVHKATKPSDPVFRPLRVWVTKEARVRGACCEQRNLLRLGTER